MPETNEHEDWLTDGGDGELALDVYQDEHNIFVVAPIAGVKASDLDVSITDEVVTIKGKRKLGESVADDQYFARECYWGPFSRSYVLPMAVNSEQAKATLKDGLLKIQIPKDAKVKTKTIPINGGK